MSVLFNLLGIIKEAIDAVELAKKLVDEDEVN